MKNNDKETTVDSLINIIEKIPETENVDSLIAFAREKLSQKKKFESFFERQLEILEERGCAKEIISHFCTIKNKVIAKALDITREDMIFFLPVIPGEFSTLFDQMEMVLVSGKIGTNHISTIDRSERPQADPFTHYVQKPRLPYYIFNIDYENTLNKSPLEIQDKYVENPKLDRRCLTGLEIVSLGIQYPDIIQRYGLFGVSSCCAGVARPLLYLGDGIPTLGSRYNLRKTPSEYEGCCSPSCSREAVSGVIFNPNIY